MFSAPWGREHPQHDHQRHVEHILWLDQTSARWNDLSESFGNERNAVTRWLTTRD